MKIWNESLTKDNMKDFIQEYAPMAYKAAYRALGDTTRAENALIEAFVETFHYRSKDAGEGPVFTFADILEKKVSDLSAKYPIPDTVYVSPRSLDDFTQSTIVGEVDKRINSLSFRVMDFLVFSDRSVQTGRNTSFFSLAVASAADSGVNLLLIIQMIIVVVILIVVTYVGAMSLFGANEYIIENPFREAQRNSLQIGEAIRYMPVDIIHRPEDMSVDSSEIDDSAALPVDDSYLSDSEASEAQSSSPSTSETESTEPSLSATRG